MAASASLALDPNVLAAKGLPYDYCAEIVPRLQDMGITNYRQLAGAAATPMVLAQIAGKLKTKPNNLQALAKAASMILADIQETGAVKAPASTEAPATKPAAQPAAKPSPEPPAPEPAKPVATPPPVAAPPKVEAPKAEAPKQASPPAPEPASAKESEHAAPAAPDELDIELLAEYGLPADWVAGIVPRLREAGITRYGQLVALASNPMKLGQAAGKLKTKPNNLQALGKVAAQILGSLQQGQVPAPPSRTKEEELPAEFTREAPAPPVMLPYSTVFSPNIALSSAAPSAMLAAALAEAQSLTTPISHVKGNRPSKLPLPPAGRLENGIHWIDYLTPVRSQGSRATGAIFALTAANEMLCRRLGKEEYLSEQHLFYEAKLLDGEPESVGTSLSAGVLALARFGQCRAVTWPYQPTHGVVPLNTRSEAGNFRRSFEQVMPNNLAAVKDHLEQGNLVAVTLHLFPDWILGPEDPTGHLPLPDTTIAPIGNHSVLIVGFQESNQAPGGGWWIIRNSWGSGWAKENPLGGGYARIPFEYLVRFGIEAFTLK